MVTLFILDRFSTVQLMKEDCMYYMHSCID